MYGDRGQENGGLLGGTGHQRALSAADRYGGRGTRTRSLGLGHLGLGLPENIRSLQTTTTCWPPPSTGLQPTPKLPPRWTTRTSRLRATPDHHCPNPSSFWNLAAGTEPMHHSLFPSPSVVVQQRRPSPRLQPLPDPKGEIEPQTSEPLRGLEPSVHCWGSVPHALCLLGLKQSQHLEKETGFALGFIGLY